MNTPSIDELQAALIGVIRPEMGKTQPEGCGYESAKPAAVPSSPCQIVDPKAKGYHLDASVAPGQLVAVAELLDRHEFAIDTVTGVDWMAAGEMEVVYDFYHMASALHVVVRTRVPRGNPEVPTISGVFPGANWHERETHEFFGIVFLGHPNLAPLLLPEDATYHPLRKDFVNAA